MTIQSYILTFCFFALFQTSVWTQTDSLIVYHCAENKTAFPGLTVADLYFEDRYSGRQVKSGLDKKILELISSKDTLKVVTLKYLEPRFAFVYSLKGKAGVIIFDEFGRFKFDPNDTKVFNVPDLVLITEQYIPKLRKDRKRQNK